MVEAARRTKHWAELDERGSEWGPALMAFVYRVLGRGACVAVLAPVVLYLYLTGFRQRRASADYLRRVWAASGRAGRPGLWQGLAHFFAFGESLIDKFAAWTGNLRRDDIDEIDAALFDTVRRDPRGALILTAHFGATEVLRALAAHHQPRKINVLMHTTHAARFNAVIQRFAPNSMVSLIEASEFDVNTALMLSEKVGRGEYVVIMGDRLPVRGAGRPVPVDFLGAPAPFPAGPFILASALKCPTYSLFCPKVNGRHRVFFSLLAEVVTLPRNDRASALRSVVEAYARMLEARVKAAPLQWFNFYDFWAHAAEREGA